MEFELLKVTIQNYIALVELANPPVNAMSLKLQAELTRCFDSFSDRDEVRVAVLTGQGKMFSAGADLKHKLGKVPEPGDRWAEKRSWRECTYSVMECKKPVICAINGPALGAGLGMVASCDILIASTAAELRLPEIGVGLLGGARRSMRLFGHSKVRRMMFTGRGVKAEELEKLGVVEAVVPPETLIDAAMEIAREIASKSPIAMKLAK